MTHNVLSSPSSMTRVYPSYTLTITNGSTNTAQRRQPLYASDHSLQTDGELISVNSGGEVLPKTDFMEHRQLCEQSREAWLLFPLSSPITSHEKKMAILI